MSVKTTNIITRKVAESMAYNHIISCLESAVKDDIKTMSNEDIEALLEKEFDNYLITDCPEMAQDEINKRKPPEKLIIERWKC